MFDDTDNDNDSATEFRGDDNADTGDDGKKSAGDGMHHHELHEDEGGGYHSKHTHPDGHVEHDDHATYEDARDKQDSDFGHGERNEDEGRDDGGDMSTGDIAGSYGRAASDN